MSIWIAHTVGTDWVRVRDDHGCGFISDPPGADELNGWCVDAPDVQDVDWFGF